MIITTQNAKRNAEVVNWIEEIIKSNAQFDPPFCYLYIRRLVTSGMVTHEMARLFYDLSVANFGLPPTDIDALLNTKQVAP